MHRPRMLGRDFHVTTGNAPGEGPNGIKFGNSIRYRRCCATAWLDEHLVLGSEASGL